MGLEISYQFPQLTTVSPQAYIGDITVNLGAQYKAWESKEARDAGKTELMKEITVSLTPEEIKEGQDLMATWYYGKLKAQPKTTTAEILDAEGKPQPVDVVVYTNSLGLDLSTAKDVIEVEETIGEK